EAQILGRELPKNISGPSWRVKIKRLTRVCGSARPDDSRIPRPDDSTTETGSPRRLAIGAVECPADPAAASHRDGPFMAPSVGKFGLIEPPAIVEDSRLDPMKQAPHVCTHTVFGSGHPGTPS